MWRLVYLNISLQLTLPKSIREQLDINVGDYLDVTIEAGKVILQKVEIIPKKIDWENEDKVWKEYAAKRLAKE